MPGNSARRLHQPVEAERFFRKAGKLTVNVVGDRLLTTQTHDIKQGIATVRIPVGKDWGTGAYVLTNIALLEIFGLQGLRDTPALGAEVMAAAKTLGSMLR